MGTIANQTGGIELDVICIGCGYNLRGLEVAGKCPECAHPVADSLRLQRLSIGKHGLPLELQSEGWWLRCGLGYFLYLLAAGALAALLTYGNLHFERGLPSWAIASWAVLDLVMWLGLICFTALAMRETRRVGRLRAAVRWLATFCFAAEIWHLLIGSRYVNTPTEYAIASSIQIWSAAAGTIVGFLYLATVAARLRRRRLSRICYSSALAAGVTVVGALGHTRFLLNGWPLRGFPIPTQPFIADPGAVDSVVQLARYSTGWLHTLKDLWPSILPILWLSWSSVLLLLFGLAFIRAAAMRRRSHANSVP